MTQLFPINYDLCFQTGKIDLHLLTHYNMTTSNPMGFPPMATLLFQHEQLVIIALSLLSSYLPTAFKWILLQQTPVDPQKRERGLHRPFIFQSLFHYSCCAYIASCLRHAINPTTITNTLTHTQMYTHPLSYYKMKL